MSKRMTQFSRLLLCSSACAAATMLAFTFSVETVCAQGGGYSIFDAAGDETSKSNADVSSANEAFTDPAKQPTSEHVGTFAVRGATAKALTTSTTPRLGGAKAIGPYAPKTQDDRGMFSSPPKFQPKIKQPASGNTGQERTGTLMPFAGNSLRSAQTAQANAPAKITAQEAPKVDNDFVKSARRLSDAPPSVSIPAASDGPKVAQTAFQEENRFSGFNGQPSSSMGSQNSGSIDNNRQFGQDPRGFQGRPSGFGNQSLAPQRPAESRPSIPASNRRSSINPVSRPLQNTTQQPMQTSFPPANRVASLQAPGSPARNVRPAQQQPPKQKRAASAKDFLQAWIATEEDEDQLSGKRLTLKGLLSQPINGSRKKAIDQYWSTFNDLANHKIAIEHARWLSTIQNSGQQIDMAMLRAARQDAKARVSETSIRLANSQAMMQELLPNLRDKKGRPIAALPSDVPWVGNLKTNYAEYKRRGMVPNKFNGIEKFFPKQRELIADRANGVSASQQAASQAKVAFAARQTPIGNVLEAARLKTKSQQDFLASVKGYNRAIADYVLTVRQDISQPTRLASVLIGSKAVRNTVASKQKPKSKSVIDRSFAGSNQNPKMIPVSSNKRINAPPRSRMAESQPESKAVAKQALEYGPTKESAKASNFDPAKVKTEAPFAKSQQNPASTYNSNNVGQARQGGGMPTRSASVANSARQNAGAGQKSPFYSQQNNAPSNVNVQQRQRMGNPTANQTSRPSVGGQPSGLGNQSKAFTPKKGAGAFIQGGPNPSADRNSTSNPLGNNLKTAPASQSNRASNAFGRQDNGPSTFNTFNQKPQPEDSVDRTAANGSPFRRQ